MPSWTGSRSDAYGGRGNHPRSHPSDGAVSAFVFCRSVWVYGDSILAFEGEDGSAWRNNTVSWTADLDASDGLTGFAERVDASGAPYELLPRTVNEAAFTARPPSEAGAWVYAGLAHAELQQGGGRIEYVTCYRTTGPFAGETRLVEVVFEQR